MSNHITYVWMNNKYPNRKRCKSMKIRNSAGELSNRTEFLRLRDNNKQVDHFLKEQKRLCEAKVMAYEVEGNSHSKVLPQEKTQKNSVKVTSWEEPMQIQLLNTYKINALELQSVFEISQYSFILRRLKYRKRKLFSQKHRKLWLPYRRTFVIFVVISFKIWPTFGWKNAGIS